MIYFALPGLLRLVMFLLFFLTTVASREWHQTAILSDVDGTSSDNFGWSVAMDNGIVVVGAFSNDIAAGNAGAAFVYGRADGDWTQEAVLTARDAAPGDYFGRSVAVRNGIVAVGAYGDNGWTGAVYVYVRDEDGTWTQQAKLEASRTNSYFGYAISMHGTTLVVGAYGDGGAGAAYVFTFDDGRWTERTKLIASDAHGGALFGYAVAVHGDRLIVGSPRNHNLGYEAGSAYLFQSMVDGTWTEQATLNARDGRSDDWFGMSVEILGDTVAVGAPHYGRRGTRKTGAVYLFKRIFRTWIQQAKLVSGDVDEGEQFGRSIALADKSMIIGAPWGGPGDASFLVSYLCFWREHSRLTVNATADEDWFGFDLAFDRHTIVVGSPGVDDAKGTVHIYEPCGRWLTRCWTPGDCCSGLCQLGRCRLF